jgi:hypothetical protein
MYIQQKRRTKIDVYWNNDILAPVKPSLDRAFRKVLEEACPLFEIETGQIIKKAFGQFDRTLKGTYHGNCYILLIHGHLKDDPQALAGDAYQLCIGRSLAAHEARITRQVSAATKKLYEGVKCVNHLTTSTYIY